MSRGHIEFIQSQQLSWIPHPISANVDYKVLSQSTETNAFTALYKFPADWHHHRTFTLNCDEELFVLHGEFWINGVMHSEGSYAYLPKNFIRHDMQCSKDALVVRFVAGKDTPVVTVDQPDERTPVMLGVDTIKLPWDHCSIDGNLKHLCASRKILRTDPVTKAKTFLYSVLPQTVPKDNEGKQKYHPTVEEALVLTGDLIGPQGAMRTGAYFWRPPEVPHGPYGSRTGCTCLIRFVGGEHIDHWTEDKVAFSFETPYQPILPDSLSHLKDKPVDLVIDF